MKASQEPLSKRLNIRQPLFLYQRGNAPRNNYQPPEAQIQQTLVFLFLENEFSEILNTDVNLSRFQIIKFAFNQTYDYLFFGYGPGSFEILFQLKFPNLSNSYANHAHSDLFEFIGEFGIVGLVFFLLAIASSFSKSINYNLINFLLLFYLFIILIFDFSLHIPLIQFLFVCFFILNQKFIKLTYDGSL